ncbi:glycerate kinase [Nocardioides mesophilus]|uniref:Glycerate kinase n=1 Tax=Nocardioides mesophilus TaxID=433659 RepID=A0A7G9RC70_9ACTN|nr:glycerate kinase [Nocardioides mesophilus]QNN53195.1 glycerate kinase [Nocardioides mesophilus]
MRVLIAPDKFAGTLTAVEAAAAIAEGWRRRSPDDVMDLVPMADGGPGFVDVLHASLGGELLAVTVTGPYGDPVPATVLLHGGRGGTAYVESAQACGLHLTPEAERDPERATSRGVGELLVAALDAGAGTVVVGLGGSGTNDGGAGLLAALGAVAEPADALDCGPSSLATLESVDVSAARDRVAGVRLVAATDIDSPLLGLIGTTNLYGPGKGVAADRLQAVDATLERLVGATDKKVALARGAGAAGGLGFALLLLGGTREPGIGLVAEAVGLAERARQADLVVTGEGAFDFSSRSGKVPYGVAAVAAHAVRPCIALAGQVLIGSREMRALGVESAYAMVDVVGEQASFADPAGSLARLAERVARTWSH